MKKHYLTIIIISILALLIFLCYTSTPLNAETFNTGKGFKVLPPKAIDQRKIGLFTTETNKPHNTQKKKISKIFSTLEPKSFLKRPLIPLKNRNIGWSMPIMRIRDDIDYKILEMHVNEDIDYKIMRIAPGNIDRYMKIHLNN